MGACIESVATTHEGLLRHKGALRLADDAARRCLERSGHDPHEVDLLVNAGIYRDHNLGEPALAALIQEDIDANPRPPPDTPHGTFSFDVSNGGCGALTGIFIVDGFLASGSAELGLVVASDANPVRFHHGGFPFPPVGGAALLTRGDRDAGFVAFSFTSYPEFADRMESRVSWRERSFGVLPGLTPGKNTLEVTERPGYGDRCVECCRQSVRRFLDALELGPDRLDVVVPCRQPIGFGDQLADALDLHIDRVAQVSEDLEGAHTAGPLASWEAASKAGQLDEAKLVLFATVGAGIQVGLALYRIAG